MADEPEVEAQYATKSYRYLRLTIVVMVFAVALSVFYEEDWTGRGCWLNSFSAYYFTPVHSMFVGAMVAVGACLIAIKGTNEWEDVCLNVAGILAPIVAFVPTNNPVPLGSEAAGSADQVLEWCASPILVGPAFDNSAFVSNNLAAMAIAGAAVVGFAYVVALRTEIRHLASAKKARSARKMGRSTKLGLAVAVAVIAALLVWYHVFHRSFIENAHDRTAIAMFVMIGVAVAINAWCPKDGSKPRYRVLYTVSGAIMVLGVVGPLLYKWRNERFEHEVIWIEAIELAGFGVFWIVQSIELWNVKVVGEPSRKGAAQPLPGAER